MRSWYPALGEGQGSGDPVNRMHTVSAPQELAGGCVLNRVPLLES